MSRRLPTRPTVAAILPGLYPSILTDASATAPSQRGSVIALGNFDGLHLGHMALVEQTIERARRVGAPSALMSAEPHPSSFFGRGEKRSRISCPYTKMRMVALSGIDWIYTPRFDSSFASITPQDFVGKILHEGLGIIHAVVGDDFRFGAKRAGDGEMLCKLGKPFGIGVTVVPEVQVDGVRCCSSHVRDFLMEGRSAQAARLLGSPWFFKAHPLPMGRGKYNLLTYDELVWPMQGTYLVSVRAWRTPGDEIIGRLTIANNMMTLSVSEGQLPMEVTVEMPWDVERPVASALHDERLVSEGVLHDAG